ncbi:MAG: hypothetical protein Q9218_006537, partial [Villophora microphyllina]
IEVAKPESSINQQSSHGRELRSIAVGCEEVLTQLDKVLVKYNALSEQERSVRRLWKKIRFGNGAVTDVAELRSRITYYTSALSLFLNLVSVGTVGNVEKKMDQAGGDLQDIKAAVNRITSQLLSRQGKEGSVLTNYTNDDSDAWRELRRGLVKAGFRGSLVRKHMDTIMAYIKELGDKGVLDDIDDDQFAFSQHGRQGEGSSTMEESEHMEGPSGTLSGQHGKESQRGSKPELHDAGRSSAAEWETPPLLSAEQRHELDVQMNLCDPDIELDKPTRKLLPTVVLLRLILVLEETITHQGSLDLAQVIIQISKTYQVFHLAEYPNFTAPR